MKVVREQTVAKYHVIKVHPQDWDERVDILKGILDNHYTWWIPFQNCLNCEKDLTEEEIASIITGKDENCPKCGKMLIEWRRSTDVGLEWMTDPSMNDGRILFEEWRKIRKQNPCYSWWDTSAATNCTDTGWWR